LSHTTQVTLDVARLHRLIQRVAKATPVANRPALRLALVDAVNHAVDMSHVVAPAARLKELKK